MFPSGSKRRKRSREFEILVVPRGDGGGTRSIKAGAAKIALWGTAALTVLFLLFFLAFRYTPLSRLIDVNKSSVSVENDTERRIRSLAEKVAELKDYNETLRKALGDRVEKRESDEALRKTEDLMSQRNHMPDQFPSELQQASPLAERGGFGSMQHIATVNPTPLLPLLAPTGGVVSQGFEPSQRHFGVDYAAKEGTPVHAAAKGYVVFAGWTYDDGNVVIISHGNGVITAYKHNSSLLKNTGSLVERGDVVALVGNAGQTSKGPHVHFEVLKDGTPVDPNQFLLNPKRAL